jgi:RHS repeat-associated protein
MSRTHHRESPRRRRQNASRAERRCFRLRLEPLEERRLLSVQPVDLVDPSLQGISGIKDSSAPSISADGQLIAFASNADNLVPNDANGHADAFVYNRTTGTVTLVSVGSDGQAAGIGGYTSPMAPVISPDGRYVVFENTGDNVLPSVTGDQLYIRDLSTGTTSLLSVAANGSGGGDRGSRQPVFSADSHHVAFISDADNLVSGMNFHDPYGTDNIFERDLVAGTTALVSIGLDGQSDGNAGSGPCNLSADGRYVVFDSSASNLVGISNSGIQQVYVRDIAAATTTMVSVDMTGLAGAGGHNLLDASAQVISADGRYVVFHSNAQGLTPTPPSGTESYIRDLQGGTTTLLSASPIDGHAVGSVGSEVISPDGRFAAFATATDNVVALPSNGVTNVYVRNLQTGALSLASVNIAGTGGGNAGSGLGTFYDFPGGLSFSPNGEYLAFRSMATNLTPGVVTGNRNLYVRDLDANRTLLVTPNLTNTDGGNGDADTVGSAVFSANGRYIAFEDTAGNLVAGDENNANDIFVRDLSTETTALASIRSPLLPAAFTSSGGANLGSVSADGRYVAFTGNVWYQAFSSDLAPGVKFSSTFSTSHVFVRDRQTGAIQVVDLDPTGTAVGGGAPVISANGRYVAFIGYTNLLPAGITAGDGHDLNIFVRDLQMGTTSVVSLDPTGTHDAPIAGFADGELAISADGNFVAWTSHNVAAVAGVQTPPVWNEAAVFLRDRQAGINYFVSHDLANDGAIDGYALDISLSADGRYVAFRSNDPNLAANDTNNGYDVFRWDRTTGLDTLVSVNHAGSGPGNAGSSLGKPAMTPDGRYIAFDSNATDLLAMPTTGENVFRRDLTTHTTVLVSASVANTSNASGSSYLPSISADGNFVAFISNAADLVSTPRIGTYNIFVRNVAANTTALASIKFDGSATANQDSAGAGPSAPPLISSDGRYVVFTSAATDLVGGFANGNRGAGDLYVRDLQQGLTRLVTVNQSGTASANLDESSDTVLLSSDGSTLVFGSLASDLFADDRNNQADVFATQTAGFSSISGQVFNDADGNGTKDGGEGGQPYWTVYIDANGDGKLDPGDPFAITDASGNYSLSNLTPGAYRIQVVPEAGYTQTTPSGSYSVTIASDGTQVSGKDFGEYVALPDLAAGSVSFSPATAAPGQAVTVSWTVKNQGSGPADGSWQDTVYLSPTSTLGPSSQLVATPAHDGGLAPNASYNASTQVILPPIQGTFFVIVQTDSRDQVNEGAFGSNKANNVAASSSTLTIAVPSLTLGQPADGQLSSNSPDAYYQLTAAAGHSLLVTLSSAAGSGALELYVKNGDLPAPYDFDFASRVPGQPGQVLTVPQVQRGTYYVFVHGVSGAAASSGFALTASEPGLSVQSLGQSSGGNAGQVTIPVHGTDLTADTQVTLVSGSTVLSPVSIKFVDGSLLYATFNLAGRPAGTYDLHIVAGSQSSSLSGAFVVQPARGPDLHVNLAVPSGIRANQTFTEVVVTYENDGDTDMPAPIFQVMFDYASAGGDAIAPAGPPIQFVGKGTDSPGGVLRAGDKGSVTIPLGVTRSIGLEGGGGGGGVAFGRGAPAGIVVSLRTFPTDTTPINWSQLQNQLRPPSIPNDAWKIVYSNFTSAVGSTTGQLQSSLVSDTAYLDQVGIDDPSFAQIMAFEMLRADAALPVPTLGRAVDVSFPAPGLSLDFSRSFYQSISGRYRLGTLGPGWVSNWDITATTEANGDVLIEDAGIARTFTHQADGSFVGSPGDHGVLVMANGVYELRETDGTLTVFNAGGTLKYVQDSKGNRITAGYNGSGQLASLTDADGQALTIGHNSQGLISTITDPHGRIAATYHYDASGQHLLSVTTPVGTTQYGYVTGQTAAEEHALASITSPDGTQVHFTYDSQGRLTGSYQGTSANPIDAVTMSYTSPGGVTFTDADNHSSTVLYTDRGQPGEIIDGLGNITRLSYDTSGNLISALLPGGATYAYAFDTHGNLVRETDPLDLTTTFTFDANNNRTSYTDAKNQTTQYGYDSNNNLLSITYANGAQQHYSYNPLGEATRFLNARGHAIGISYSRQGQITGETFADGTSYSYTHDTRGNLTTATDGQKRVTTFVYGGDASNPNNPDLLTEVDYLDGTFLKFSYYPGGLRKQSVDQTGFTLNYAFDPAGRLLELTDGSGNLIVQYTYDPAGNLTQKDMGNGTRTVYSYDSAGNVLSITNYAPDHTTVNSFDNYTYDGRRNVLTDTNQDGQWVYGYDADGQLTHAVLTLNSTNPDGLTAQDLTYVYDAAGNRVSETVNGVTTTYVTNNVNEYTSSTTAGAGTTTYQYDLDGNLIAQTDPSNNTTNCTFNDLNQLTAVNGSSLSASYFYDPLGNLVSQTVSGTTTNFQIDPIRLGNVVGAFGGTGVYNNSGGLSAHYTYGLGLVSQVSAGGAAGYYDFGLTGSTIGITSSAGTYVNRYSYLPFGAATTLSATLPNPFTFVGRFGVTTRADALLHMGFRAYDTATGRFVSKDPLGLAGGDTNTRRYAANDPVNRVDPMGLAEGPMPSPEEMAEFYSQVGEYLNNYLDALKQLEEDGFKPDSSNEEAAVQTELENLPEDQLANAIDALGGTPELNAEQQARLEQLEQEVQQGLQGGAEAGGAGGLAGEGGTAALGLIGVLAFFGSIAYFDVGQDLADIFPQQAKAFGDWLRKYIPFLASADPNNLLGPAGFGTPNWIVDKQDPLTYSIEFENDPKKANVAAQDVTVTEQLDPNLDWSTFQLGSIQVGAITIDVPNGLKSYSTTYSTTNVDGTPLKVNISAGLNEQTGLVTWTFLSVDPATGLAPSDPVAGFLPVDDSTGRGQGLLNYNIEPKAGLTTGTAVQAQATVVFDTNAPLSTDTVSNTIDTTVPTSSVAALPATETSPSFNVSWSGSDGTGASAGSGIAGYNVYVSDNGGPSTLWQSNTTNTSVTYAGQLGHTYRFYSVATSNVGLVQPTPTTAQATTKVVLPGPPLVTMTKVKPVMNSKKQVTQVLITLSGPVNAKEAGNIKTYRLATPGTGGSYTAKNAGLITLKSAVYTAVTHTVALTPTKPFSLTKPVQLLVYGTGHNGLQDSHGRLIDGDHNGTPGGNAVAILFPNGAKIAAIPQAQIKSSPIAAAAVDALLARNHTSRLFRAWPARLVASRPGYSVHSPFAGLRAGRSPRP